MKTFAMPAEWAQHDAVWTAWPHDEDQWAEGLAAPRKSLMEMCSAISDGGRGERVELFVRNADDEAAARALLGSTEVSFHRASYGDVWLRDTGPIFVTRDGDIAAARFRFDGWGGKYVMEGDRELSGKVAELANIRGAAFDFVLEGGAVEVDGAGRLMTTKQCLLGGKRNAGLDQAALDARLRWSLGAETIIWLDQGLQNDHTDGHIDTIARFIAPGVAMCMEPAANDPNREAMLAIMRDLKAAKLEVVTVPSPGAVLDAEGALMPASYMNFYIANTTVVVPLYQTRVDAAVQKAFEPLFPTRRVVGVDCKPVVVGGGGFHCCTQQQPRI